MWNSLPAFYNSAEWRSFRQTVISERRNKSDGILYDEYNGQPLLKSYDTVLHHKTPLTVKNVNDFDISLNPDNIMIVSQRSHNEIHARFGYCTERKVYYVYGAPCSGKTTFVKNIKGNSDIVLDMDSIWQCLTAGDRYDKPAAIKSNVFTVRNCIMDMIRTRSGKWERAFVISGGAVKGIRERDIQALGAEGILVWEDAETCKERLANDPERTPEQKEQWIKYIDEWFEDYTE